MTSLDRYAVFGQPIKHSKSPRIHQLFAEQTGQALQYDAVEVAPDNFEKAVDDFLSAGGKGLNCTLPLKELAYELVRFDATPRATFAKAVNTLFLVEDNHLKGDNTDGAGLVKDLTVNHGVDLCNKRVLILGAGGATRGIIVPLLEQNLQAIVVANRTVEKAVQLVEAFREFEAGIQGCGFADLQNQSFDIILNATSASLNGQLPPLPDGLLAEQGVCYDLAYGNEPTAFVRWGQAQQALKSVDGLGMLVEQAAEAFFIWRGVRPETQAVIALLNAERGL